MVIGICDDEPEVDPVYPSFQMKPLSLLLVAGLVLAAVAVVPAQTVARAAAITDAIKLKTGLVSGLSESSADVRVFKAYRC